MCSVTGRTRIRALLVRLPARIAPCSASRATNLRRRSLIWQPEGADARILRTAVRAPLMSAVCERFLGSVRRECLNHIVILSERHLRHVLGEYAMSYFNTARPHQGRAQRSPLSSDP